MTQKKKPQPTKIALEPPSAACSKLLSTIQIFALQMTTNKPLMAKSLPPSSPSWHWLGMLSIKANVAT